MSSLEVDVTLDPSPLAFAPWSLKYLSKEKSSAYIVKNKHTKKKRTSLQITIDESKNERKCSQNNTSAVSESDVKLTNSPLPSIPTLSIHVAETIDPEKESENNHIVQVEVHRHNDEEDGNEADNVKGWNEVDSSNDFSYNKNYLQIPSMLFG